ncbi:MAG: hypothetical protein M2R45_02840 [Verrucomicrobia subdivision 3 bacterium]|nr:hypothetical protein [Limisphaerales bacterium]
MRLSEDGGRTGIDIPVAVKPVNAAASMGEGVGALFGDGKNPRKASQKAGQGVDHAVDRAVELCRSATKRDNYPTDNDAEVISSNSLVMLAWRSLLYSRVRSLISWLALSVALFMATMRALCSLALHSNNS